MLAARRRAAPGAAPAPRTPLPPHLPYPPALPRAAAAPAPFLQRFFLQRFSPATVSPATNLPPGAPNRTDGAATTPRVRIGSGTHAPIRGPSIHTP